MEARTTRRQPAIYLSHGGGPCFWMEFPEPIGPGAFDRLRNYLAGLLASRPERPRAFLVVSAHWEEIQPTVSTALHPRMLFDYYGFPEHTYQLAYPAPGDPALAAEVRSLLRDAGIDCALDESRGFDHGVFVPFLIIDPEARIPVVMLSLRSDLDPELHLRIGAAISPLRDRGVAIVGSGMSYHNLAGFLGEKGVEASAQFDAWLEQVVVHSDPVARNAGLAGWADAPRARECHPRPEHLMPLMVIAGSAGRDAGRRTFRDAIAGKQMSCFEFGGDG